MTEKRHVIVEWLDANCDSSWQPPDHIIEPAKCFTCGWVQHENKIFIQIAGTVAEDGNYNQSMTIPRGMVVSIKDL
jgi:hypothetical protein